MPSIRTAYKETIDVGQIFVTGDDYGPVAAMFDGADLVWPDGTSANQADEFAAYLGVTETGSNDTDYDLQALAGPGGVTVNLTEVRALFINVTAGDVTLSPHATNGWTGLLADATDVLKLAGIGKYRILCGVDGAYPVSGTNKVLTIAATGSGATYDMLIVGASA